MHVGYTAGSYHLQQACAEARSMHLLFYFPIEGPHCSICRVAYVFPCLSSPFVDLQINLRLLWRLPYAPCSSTVAVGTRHDMALPEVRPCRPSFFKGWSCLSSKYMYLRLQDGESMPSPAMLATQKNVVEGAMLFEKVLGLKKWVLLTSVWHSQVRVGVLALPVKLEPASCFCSPRP
jgi:hypothetical protein